MNVWKHPTYPKRCVKKTLIRDPKTSKWKDWFFFNGPHYLAILGITKDGKIIIIHEYFEGPDAYKWHIVTGGMEKNESIEECAKRELEEESGFIARRIIKLSKDWHSMRDSQTKCIHCVALDCEDTGKKKFDQGESIQEVKTITVQKFLKLIERNIINDNQTKAVFTSALAKGYINIPERG